MQIIHHWPLAESLALPTATQIEVLKHLIAPFGDETAAKAFWDEYPSLLIILDALDSEHVLQCLDDLVAHHLEQAMTCPEYQEPIGKTHNISLTITSDEGAGLYLVYPRQTLFNFSKNYQAGDEKCHD